MSSKKRIDYIDNIRWMTILLLIPFHAGMAFNSWESNYVYFDVDKKIGSFVQFIWPWMMPILFVLAGISASYSIKNRGMKGFVFNRICKLLIPIILGALFVVPVMTYFAAMNNSGFDGSFSEHLDYFFNTVTDVTGYDGAFTIGHLWFLAYLFVISLIGVGIIYLIGKITTAINGGNELDIYDKGLKVIDDTSKGIADREDNKGKNNTKNGNIKREDKTADKVDNKVGKVNRRYKSKWFVMLIIAFGLLPFVLSDILSIGGKSVLSYLCYFLIGYYVLSDRNAVREIARYRVIFMLAYIMLAAASVYMFIWMKNANGTLNLLCMYMAGWFGCLGIIGVFRARLNKSNKLTRFLSRTSFLLYVFHFPILIVIQYYMGFFYDGLLYRFFIPIILAYIGTFIFVAIASLFDNIASYFTAGRIVCSIYMVLVEPFSNVFFLLYFAAGISDILDGYFARKLKLTSKKGAVLDSISDIVFAAAIIFVLISNVTIPSYVWQICVGIIMIKMLSFIAGIVKFKKMIMIHTYLNKLTGMLLFMFLVVYQLLDTFIIAVIIAIVAGMAAIEELALIITSQEINPDEKGYITRTSFYYNVISSAQNNK